MQNNDTTGNKTNIVMITGIVVAVVIVGLIILSVISLIRVNNSSNNIATLTSQVAALQGQFTAANVQLNSLSSQITAASSQLSTLSGKESSDIASLKSGMSSVNSQISSLTDQVNSFISQLATLQTNETSDASGISLIQTQLSSIKTQLTTFGNTATTLQNAVNSLQSDVTTLIAQVNSLTAAASNPLSLFTSQLITQAFNTQTTIYTFTPAYAGSISISGTSNSTTGYIRVTNSSLGTFVTYPFGTGTTVTATVSAGYIYAIIFGNSDSSGTITATLSATYYPNSSPTTTNPTPLFTSLTISQAYSTQTIVYSFTPSFTGNVQISGTSSSVTAYIRVVNTSLQTSSNYAFGTGTTVIAPVSAGYNYSIIFTNSDSSGTVTATLSATYFH